MTLSRARRATLAAESAEASMPSPGAWRRILARAVRDPAELRRRLDLPPDPDADAADADFPVLVPPGYLARIRRGDPDDPLLRQVLPMAAERRVVAGYGPDPVGEQGCQPVPGLLRKYRGRALVIATAACAVHCRYCFRRAFPYDAVPRGRRWWRDAAATIAADPEVEEVLLSGGDPLSLPDANLAAMVADLVAAPQVQRLRIHTRLPVMLPERVDPDLLAWIAGCRCDVVVVLHANHPAEIDSAVAAACERLRAAGCLLFNQAVLLRSVNDDAATLARLSRRLARCGVVPYYLHALDPVAGAAHFAVADDRAAAIMRELHADLPGYLLPRLVREVAGEPGKRHLAW